MKITQDQHRQIFLDTLRALIESLEKDETYLEVYTFANETIYPMSVPQESRLRQGPRWSLTAELYDTRYKPASHKERSVWR